MPEPFISEIRIFPYNFAPKGWAFCNGQELPVTQFQQLFTLIGSTFGGNGQTTFALPALHGRIAIEAGQGPGLSTYTLGQMGGQETVPLTQEQVPAHSHDLNATTASGSTDASKGNQLAQGLGGSKSTATMAAIYSSNLGKATTALAPLAIAMDGSGEAHQNMMPYVTLSYCIALEGEFPARN